MSWAHVQGTSTENTVGTTGVTSLTLAFGSNVTAGNLLVLGMGSFQSGGTFSVQDSLNLTNWTQAVVATNTNLRSAIFWFVTPQSGSATVTLSTTFAAFPGITIDEFSFTANSTISADNSGAGSGSSTSLAITTNQPSNTLSTTITPMGTDLIYGVGCVGAAGTWTQGSGFTPGYTGTFASSKAEAVFSEWVLNQSSVITPAASFSVSTPWAFAATAFLPTAIPAAAGGGAAPLCGYGRTDWTEQRSGRRVFGRQLR